MASLADELMNDFDDSDSETELQDYLNQEGDQNQKNGHAAEDPGYGSGDEEDAEQPKDAEDVSVSDGSGLMRTLQPVLHEISQYQTTPSESTTLGSLDDNPEYRLLTKSNALSTEIDSEVIAVHKYIRDHYSARFPELETLVTNPLDYAKTVAVLCNGPFDNIRNLSTSTENLTSQPLRNILDGPTLMVVTVEGTTTKGTPLSPSELKLTLDACSRTISLERAKNTLTTYVTSRMTLFCPNLTSLIGPQTSAQLLNQAGGLSALAKTPACNIAALGSKRQTQTGFATNVGIRQQGFLYHSEILTTIPSDLKKQAMRIVSAKLILCARIDLAHTSPSGTDGALMREACLTRLDKLSEPAPNSGTRALPAPDDKPSRKRGGRRARKAKEATEMTDLRKQQNRMAFGKEEREVGYGTGEGTKGLGMIGMEGDGRIRATAIDARTRAKLSKKNPGWGGASSTNGLASTLNTFGSRSGAAGSATSLRAAGLRAGGVGSASTSGMQSSIAFTPVQGLELVDPKAQAELKRKRDAESDRWFKGGTFTQVGGASTSSLASAPAAVKAEGGFKVPQVPASKRTGMGPPSAPPK